MSTTIQDALSTAILGGGFGSQSEGRVTTTGAQETSVQQQDEGKQQYLAPGSMDEKSTKKVTEELNAAMERANSNLEFKYHKEVNMMSVAVVDKTSGKVIKELPPEEMVNNMIKSKIWIGAFLDKIA